MNEDNKKILTEELSKMEKKLGLDENLLAEILGLEREHQWTTNRNLEDRLDDIITLFTPQNEYSPIYVYKQPVSN